MLCNWLLSLQTEGIFGKNANSSDTFPAFGVFMILLDVDGFFLIVYPI